MITAVCKSIKIGIHTISRRYALYIVIAIGLISIMPELIAGHRHGGVYRGGWGYRYRPYWGWGYPYWGYPYYPYLGITIGSANRSNSNSRYAYRRGYQEGTRYERLRIEQEQLKEENEALRKNLKKNKEKS